MVSLSLTAQITHQIFPDVYGTVDQGILDTPTISETEDSVYLESTITSPLEPRSLKPACFVQQSSSFHQIIRCPNVTDRDQSKMFYTYFFLYFFKYFFNMK